MDFRIVSNWGARDAHRGQKEWPLRKEHAPVIFLRSLIDYTSPIAPIGGGCSQKYSDGIWRISGSVSSGPWVVKLAQHPGSSEDGAPAKAQDHGDGCRKGYGEK